jgi:hypothetical protein
LDLSTGRTLKKKEPHASVMITSSTHPIEVACFSIVHTFEQLDKFEKSCQEA